MISYLVYADKLQLHVHFPLAELELFVSMRSRNADYVSQWASINHLRLNVQKSKAIVIGSHYYIYKLSKMGINGITLNHNFIPFESEVCNLGVWFDSTLNRRCHITFVRNPIHYYTA